MPLQRSLKAAKLSLAALASLAGIFLASASAETKLDIGSEYRVRGVQYSNPTYGSEITSSNSATNSTLDQNYYNHRARFYIKAKLDPGIEIGTVMQAIGVQGSTQALLNRYPKEDFTPFVENAYISANEMFGLPINASIGRIPYRWGSGLLIDDDGLGFNGVKMDVGPFWGLRTHLFSAKVKENVGGGDSDLHLAGLSYSWGIHRFKLGWIWDRDRSGSTYTNLSTTTMPSQYVSRQYYNVQIDARLEKGAFYNVEYAMQSGKAQIPNGTATQDYTISGDALTFEGGFDFVHPRYKRMILAFVFMQGSGDKGATGNEDEKFNARFGHKYDGFERVGAGEFFAATPYSFFNEERVMVRRDAGANVTQWIPYTSLFSGLRTFGFRGSVNPIDSFVAGLEFYIYTSRETPTQPPLATTIDDNELGRELIITAQYTYAKRINFALRWGKFFPAAVLNNLGASRLMFEAQARF